MLKRIVIIGPVYPYKGGISHYTSLLCNNLKKKYDTSIISFKMQYPKILFRKPQKDFANDMFKIENTEYLINTANPFNWIVVANKIKLLEPDLVIVQWWHPYFAPCFKGIIKRLGKIKVFLLCHNVFPHERFPMDKWLTKSVLKNVDGFIVHTEKDAADLLSVKKNAMHISSVLPTFNVFKYKGLSQQHARKLLNIGEKDNVLLFFGFVKEYKGLRFLIQAMPYIINQCNDIKLLIVGDFEKNKTEYLDLIKKEKVSEHIEIKDGYIPDRDIEIYFASSDLVVLPYTSATQSGIVQIAYGFEKPVIVTDVGGLPEVVINDKTGYIVPPKNSTALASAIIRFFNEDKKNAFINGVKEEAYKYEWDRMTETIEYLWQI